MEGDISELKL